MQTEQIIARHRPVELGVADLRARIARWPCPTLLGGDGRFARAGRWSILAAHPRLIFESPTGRGLHTSGGGIDTWSDGDALTGLATILEDLPFGATEEQGLDDAPPFQGGLIGFLSYDLAPRIESIPRRLAADSRLPALRFGLYDTFVLVDHDRAQASVWAVDLLGDGEEATLDRLESWSRRLGETPSSRVTSTSLGPVAAEQSRASYLARVGRVREYIHAGDVFQVNLSQRFGAAGTVDPIELDRRLQASSPAPYSAFLRWDDLAILSVSPELFYETRGRQIITRPIKGTRPRSLDPRTDAAMLNDLLFDPKDGAELTMIIDLERNDLGRICDYGSISVAEPRSVESYQNVHHTVATVEGRLRGDVGPIDVVRAMFPGGSITGAPKIRAMEIIDELEPCRRGAYTGAVGYWSTHGRSAFNIAIRTVVVEEGQVRYQVGGGIVADSDPEKEYQETLDKGRTLFATLTGMGAER